MAILEKMKCRMQKNGRFVVKQNGRLNLNCKNIFPVSDTVLIYTTLFASGFSSLFLKLRIENDFA